MTAAPIRVSLAAPAAMTLAVVGSDRPFPVRRIYCVGRNYLDHIREMKEADERNPPFFFQKPTDAVVPDGATVPYPSATDDFQFEVELVAAIGRGGSDISTDEAEAHIFGYAIGIDLTRRDLQREAAKRGLPWEMGKSFDHSAPCGPIHCIASTGAIRKGAITLSVNGTGRQKSDIAYMIWNVAEVIANLSRQYELHQGDLIFTGTPAGVGPVVPGDRLECAIEGLGTLRINIGPKKS
jgi:fumarylpyruvate hydrolase